MFALFLALFSFAAEPPWLSSCTAQGSPDQARVQCMNGTAMIVVLDGPPGESAELVRMNADGFIRSSSGQLTHDSTSAATIQGVPAARLDVFHDERSSLYSLRGAGPRPGGGRLVSCTVRAANESDGRAACEPALAWFVVNGTAGLTIGAGEEGAIRSVLGTKLPAMQACRLTETSDIIMAVCDTGSLQLLRVPAETTPALFTKEAINMLRRGLGEGKEASLGEGACAVQGAAKTCQTIVLSGPQDDMKGVAAAMTGDKGEVVAVCIWGPGVPKPCAAVFTQLPDALK